MNERLVAEGDTVSSGALLLFCGRWSRRENVCCTGLMWSYDHIANIAGTQANIYVGTYNLAVDVSGVEGAHYPPS